MNNHDPGHDPELRRLLDDAVRDINPHEGISAIRARTNEKEKPMPRRSALFGAAGAAVATAAVIGVVVATGALDTDDKDGDNTPVATPRTPSATVDDPTPATSDPTPDDPDTAPEGHAIAVYHLGDSGRGPVLYREFQRLDEPDHGFADDLGALMSPPLDPDYRTLWQPGDLTGATLDETSEVLRVEIRDAAMRQRPDGISRAEAEASVQQVVYTLQAAAGERAPVQFVLDGNPVDQVWGVATAEPLAHAFEALSMMSITTPAEGETVSGTFTATGVNNGFEAWVGYQILKDGNEVASDFGMAEGWAEEKLFPWEVEVDVSDLEPGEYVLRFHNDDPSGGTEGSGPDEDTRTIIVE